MLLFLVATGLVGFTVGGTVFAFAGNIQLVHGLKRFLGSEGELLGMSTYPWGLNGRSDAVGFLHTRTLWSSARHGELASECGDALCMCFAGPSVGRSGFFGKLNAYYYALSYRIGEGKFPEMDSCVDQFVPSSFLYDQRAYYLRAEREDLAGLVQELAYLVDTGWRSQWQRGHIAFKQGDAYLRAGETELAREAFARAAYSLMRSNDDRSGSYASWSLSALGDIALSSGDLAGAVRKYERSISVSSETGQAGFIGLARAWRQQGRESEYILRRFEGLRQARGASNPFLTSWPVDALLTIGETQAARRFLEAAPADVQPTAPVLGARGKVAEETGELGAAEAYYVEALATSLDDGESLLAARWAVRVADLCEALGEPERALSNLQLAVELNPSAKWYWYRLGRLHQDRGEMDKARRAFEQALMLDPNNDTFKTEVDELGD